jgi:hypothetical protein
MVVSVPTTDYPRIIARRKSAFCKRERKRERERGEREKRKRKGKREREKRYLMRQAKRHNNTTIFSCNVCKGNDRRTSFERIEFITRV